LAFGRSMDLGRNGHQAKGEDAAGDRSSHGLKITKRAAGLLPGRLGRVTVAYRSAFPSP
jgi:hypothetical protein